MKNRRTEITVKTYEVLIMSRRSALDRTRRPTCGKPVAVVRLNEAPVALERTSNPATSDDDRAISLDRDSATEELLTT